MRRRVRSTACARVSSWVGKADFLLGIVLDEVLWRHGIAAEPRESQAPEVGAAMKPSRTWLVRSRSSSPVSGLDDAIRAAMSGQGNCLRDLSIDAQFRRHRFAPPSGAATLACAAIDRSTLPPGPNPHALQGVRQADLKP